MRRQEVADGGWRGRAIGGSGRGPAAPGQGPALGQAAATYSDSRQAATHSRCHSANSSRCSGDSVPDPEVSARIRSCARSSRTEAETPRNSSEFDCMTKRLGEGTDNPRRGDRRRRPTPHPPPVRSWPDPVMVWPDGDPARPDRGPARTGGVGWRQVASAEPGMPRPAEYALPVSGAPGTQAERAISPATCGIGRWSGRMCSAGSGPGSRSRPPADRRTANFPRFGPRTWKLSCFGPCTGPRIHNYRAAVARSGGGAK